MNCDLADLDTSDFCSLTFSNQKNGVKNEKIGHVRSGHIYVYRRQREMLLPGILTYCNVAVPSHFRGS
jgi:hypothetical protein